MWALNATAGTITASHAEVDLNDLLGIRAVSAAGPAAASLLDEHTHDETVSAISLRVPGPLNREQFAGFLEQLLTQRGNDILRIKGILAWTGEHRCIALQGVHELVDLYPLEPWGDEPTESRMVLIGRDLDAAAIEGGLSSCLAET